MELKDAVMSVADQLGVPFKEVFSAIDQFVGSMKKSRYLTTRARASIKLDPSRDVKLSEETWGLGKIPAITLTQNVRLGVYAKPGENLGKKEIAVRLMRRNEDAPGLYNSSALSRGEFNALNRSGWKDAICSPGMVKLNPR